MTKIECLTRGFVIEVSGFIRYWCLVIRHSCYSSRGRVYLSATILLPFPLNALSIESNFTLTKLALAHESTDS
jgi:hypothetical protein